MSSATPVNGEAGGPTKCPLQYRMEPPKRDAYDSIITVRFDLPESRDFQVHRGLICHFSDFFRGALNNNFPEGKEGIVALPEEDFQGFKTFFGWMYTGQWEDAPKEVAASYVFAEKRGIPGFKNAIIDYLIDIHQHRILHTAAIRQIWPNVPEYDGIRQLYVDLLTYLRIGPSFYDPDKAGQPEHLPSQLILQVLRNVGTSSGRPDFKASKWFVDHRCEYHDHRDLLAQRDRVQSTIEGTNQT